MKIVLKLVAKCVILKKYMDCLCRKVGGNGDYYEKHKEKNTLQYSRVDAYVLHAHRYNYGLVY